MVIDHGAIPILVKLLGSPSDDVREQVSLQRCSTDLSLSRISFAFYYLFGFVNYFIES